MAGAGERGTRCSGRRTIDLGRKSRSSRCWRSMLMYAPRVRPRRPCSRRRPCPVPRPDCRRRSMGGTVCRACSSSNQMRRTTERIGAGAFRGCEAGRRRPPGWGVRLSSRGRAAFAEDRIALRFGLGSGILASQCFCASGRPRRRRHPACRTTARGCPARLAQTASVEIANRIGGGANRSLRPSVSRRLDGVPPPETPGLCRYTDVAARPGDGRPRPYWPLAGPA